MSDSTKLGSKLSYTEGALWISLFCGLILGAALASVIVVMVTSPSPQSQDEICSAIWDKRNNEVVSLKTWFDIVGKFNCWDRMHK